MRHLVMDKYLNHITLGELLQDNPEFSPLVEEIETNFSYVVSGEKTFEVLTSVEEIKRTEQTIRSDKESMSASSKTSQLWLGYHTL